MSNNINENTFVGMAYRELSQEGFGLPSIRSLRVRDESNLWKNQMVAIAARKAQAYAMKHHYVVDVDLKNSATTEEYIVALLKKRGFRKIDAEVIKEASKVITFKKYNGVTIMCMRTRMTKAQTIAAAVVFYIVFSGSLSALLGAVGTISTGAAVLSALSSNLALTIGTKITVSALGGVLSVVGAAKIGSIVLQQLKIVFEKTNKNYDIDIFGSWVMFKKPDGKIVLKQFCNCIVDKDMSVSKGMESIETAVSDETDDVSMTDLVDDETTVDEDAGKDSKPAVTTPNPAETEHNEEASAGGVVAGDNSDDISIEPTSIEAWYDDSAFSLEDACMDCLVNEETTVDEDAGKDSETAEVTPSPAETEHNEGASAGGVATGDNNSDLEVAPVSEEAGSTESFNMDYDTFSTEEFKPIDGVFDINDL